VIRWSAGVVLAVALVVACGPATPSPTLTLAPAASPTSLVTPSPSAAIVVDPSLLDALPASLDGIDRSADVATATEIAASPDLAQSISTIAVAIYPSPTDYAVVTVAGLRPGVFDDAWFRDWRDSFDTGVCGQAGGVDLGRSEMAIGGRTVFRSTCAGGTIIYHAHLEASDAVVSIQGSGGKDLGRQVMAGLTE